MAAKRSVCLKRPRSDEIIVFYAPQKIVKARLSLMKTAMIKLGVHVVDDTTKLSERFTHLVTGFEYEEDVWKKLGCYPHGNSVAVISTAWHADSIRAGRPLPTEPYQLPQRRCPPSEMPETTLQEDRDDYACQRRTPLDHLNKTLTDALEVLEEEANLRGSENDYSRALSFRNCACVLKSLTFTVTRADQIEDRKDIGRGHCLRVIKEILRTGYSSEVESVLSSEWFQSMRQFVNVFGVGAATANRWFHNGLRNITDVLQCEEILKKNDPRLAVGLAYYDDLAMLVKKQEALLWQDSISTELQTLVPGATVEITGGFRRGKLVGHDIDLLISHPKEGSERGLLPRLLTKLQSLGIIIYGRYEKSSFNDHVLSTDTMHTPLKSTLDHFEKWIGVVRMNSKLLSNDIDEESKNNKKLCFIPESLRKNNPSNAEVMENTFEETPECSPSTVKDILSSVEPDRDWVARRVDLIIAPIGQYYYALVGWTGSKHFNRSARRYAQNVWKMKLTSHGLWDCSHRQALPAASEKEVFERLKLTYCEPTERNC